MKRAAIYSAILHLIVFILMIVGIYSSPQRSMAEQKPIMVEFVNIDEFSQAPVLAPQDVQEPDPVEQPKQEPKPTPVSEPLPQPEPPKPEPLPEVRPEPAVPELPPPPPEPESAPAPLPEPEPEEIEVEPIATLEPKKPEKPKEEPKPKKPKEEPQPVEKKKKKDKQKEKVEINLADKKKKKKSDKKPDPKAKKKAEDSFDDILDSIADNKPDKGSQDLTNTSSGKIKGAPADRVGPVLTASEIDAVRQKISKCWIVPNGVRGAKDLVVPIDMKISRDGTVVDAKIVDKGKMSDITYRATAESAQRAAVDPNCQPLPLNPEKYEQWKEMRLNFDPKDMY